MEVALTRDWIIIIAGILEILLLLGLIVSLIIIYVKINRIIKKGKETVRRIEEQVDKIEKTISSPYYKIAAWLLRAIAAVLGGSKKRKQKEER